MKISENETVVMRSDSLDDDSIVVNFDVLEKQCVTKEGGYVHIRQVLDFFSVCVFDCEGTVLGAVNVPFKFKEIDQ